jgi:hypothetical protein
MASAPFVPVEGQCFSSHQQWVNKASSWLTAHPQYRNTEHGESKGWRGKHFTALCFDQKGRRVSNGGDFQRAHDENAFPVWWIWPDQIAPILMGEEIAHG